MVKSLTWKQHRRSAWRPRTCPAHRFGLLRKGVFPRTEEAARAPAPFRALLRNVSPAPAAASGPRTRRETVQAAQRKAPRTHRPRKVLCSMPKPLTPQTRVSLQRVSEQTTRGPRLWTRDGSASRPGPEGSPPLRSAPLCAPGPAPSLCYSSLLFNIFIPCQMLHLPSSKMRAHWPLGQAAQLSAALGRTAEVPEASSRHVCLAR